MTLIKHIVLALLLLVVTSDFANSQQVQNRPVLTGLILEVVSLKTLPPSYQRVFWSTDRPGGTWYARFGRIARWQLPSGALPVQAVNVSPALKDDVVTLKVSVFRGVEFHDTEEAVATYSARENETVVIEDLKRFGVEPFKIKVVRAVPTNIPLPAIVNKTQSAEVINIEPVLSTLPMFALNVHNLATKNISAIKLNVVRDGTMQTSGLPQGKEGAPLIQAGGSATLRLPAATRAEATPAGFAPSSPPNQEIVIAAVIFDDGTYEGNADDAASFRGFTVGRKVEFKRLIPILESALAATEKDVAVSPAKLRVEIETLSYDVDSAELGELTQSFPTLSPQRMKGSVDVAVHGVRRDLLEELQVVQKNPNADFRRWLATTRDRYVNWLARLSPANP